jgi:hypothetical protein
MSPDKPNPDAQTDVHQDIVGNQIVTPEDEAKLLEARRIRMNLEASAERAAHLPPLKDEYVPLSQEAKDLGRLEVEKARWRLAHPDVDAPEPDEAA